MSDAFTRHRAARALGYDELPPELEPQEIATLYDLDRRECSAVASFIKRAIDAGTLPARVHVVTVEQCMQMVRGDWIDTSRFFSRENPETLPPWRRPKAATTAPGCSVTKQSTRDLLLVTPADFAAWPDRPPPKPGAWVWAWLELAAPAAPAKPRPSAHHEAARAAAAKLWKENPTITIADMILRDEIAHACDDKLYTERVLRDWIKDLCPNRKPGRRRKKPPAENSTPT